jgi:hypothetical protein
MLFKQIISCLPWESHETSKYKTQSHWLLKLVVFAFLFELWRVNPFEVEDRLNNI